MADLKYSELAAQFTTDAIKVASAASPVTDGVVIVVGKITGDVTNSMSVEGVTECLIKLLEGAQKAQTVYNTANPNAPLNAYPEANYGIPTKGANGSIASSVTASVVGIIPLNGNSIC